MIRFTVVPRAGTWIETEDKYPSVTMDLMSFPVRERGLKPDRSGGSLSVPLVVPRAGTWIETANAYGG